MMSQHLPEEVVYDILIRLPVKSIFRFRCVSKSWNSIFTKPIFITTHFNFNQAKSLSNNSHNGFLLYTHKISYNIKELRTVICNSDHTLTHVSSFQIPSFEFPIHNRVIGFCKGLFCLTSYMGNSYWKIYLWNPSIRKITIAGTTNNNALANVTLGFAYHPQNNDFKILRLVCYPCKTRAPAEVEVYTLSTASWRRFVIPDSLSGSSIWVISESPSLFFKGALHFLALASTQNDIFNRFILTFDVDEEIFHEIMLPPNYLSEKYVRHTKCLTVFKGLLALIVFNCETEQSDICHIWAMREYGVVESWTKISVPIKGVARFFGCTVKGELVMGKRSPSQIFSFDPESLNEEILAIPTAKDVIYTDYFVESLNLLDRLNTKDY